MYFDARAAKLLQPGQHLLVTGCAGLRLVATASRRTWQYRYKAADGRMKQVALGQWPAMPVQAAAAAWQAQRDHRSAGADPVATRKAERAALRVAAPGVYTVQRLVDDYKQVLDGARQAAGAAAAKGALQRLLDAEPDFASMPAADVSRTDAFTLLDKRKAWPTATAKVRGLLGAAWDHALDAGRVDGNTPNWWRLVLRGKLVSKGKHLGGRHLGRQRRVLSPAEIAALLAWLPNMHSVGADAVVLYLWTCTRGVEIFGMRPEHVRQEADGWWWQVPKAQTKNAGHPEAVDLRVPLVGRALKVVQRRVKTVGPSGWLFEGQSGQKYQQHDFSSYVYNLQPYSPKVSGRQGDGLVLPVTHWTPHNLRRTARTLLASLGCSNEVGEAIVGHLPAEMVATYNAYSYDAERRQWLKRLATYLEALAVKGLPARP